MKINIGRRAFIATLSGAATWPLSLRAQQSAMPVIGFLSSRSPGESIGLIAAFHQGLREAGFVEGQNLAMTFRWAEGHYDRLPALAVELVDQRVAVILAAGGSPSALAAKAATSAVPIVFTAVSAPVQLGLVASLNRPGGNLTGMGMFGAELWAKNVELLKELVPSVTVAAYLMNPSSPSAKIYAEAAATVSAQGIQVYVLNASTEHELHEAFASLIGLKAGGLIVPNEPFFDSQRHRIVELAAREAIPAIYGAREYVVDGGLLSYGASIPDSYRQAGIYIARILKGEKPADLPVMQPTKFELVINLKTARALDLTVPPNTLAIADEVIE
jgi:putative ABC transport system substrate-binding protein